MYIVYIVCIYIKVYLYHCTNIYILNRITFIVYKSMDIFIYYIEKLGFGVYLFSIYIVVGIYIQLARTYVNVKQKVYIPH